MRDKEIYCIENLNRILQRDGATLRQLIDKVRRHINVAFICNCGKEGFKNAYSILKVGGAFCDKCTRKNARIKTVQTFINNYGREHVLQVPEIKERAKRTLIQNHGVEYTLRSPVLKEKARQTTIIRFGTEYASQSKEFRQQVQETCQERYGVDCTLKHPEVQEKIKQTCIKRYGVENSAQSQEIQEKTQRNARKYKEYTMPSGIVRKVQGYEPFALRDLLQTHKEEGIKTDRKDIPRIAYETNGKTRYYFPDIYLPNTNTIIEVKSTWTYKSKTDSIKEKENATKAAGYNYEIWIYDGKGNRMDREKFEIPLTPIVVTDVPVTN